MSIGPDSKSEGVTSPVPLASPLGLGYHRPSGPGGRQRDGRPLRDEWCEAGANVRALSASWLISPSASTSS
jgi:hypothetical protein